MMNNRCFAHLPLNTCGYLLLVPLVVIVMVTASIAQQKPKHKISGKISLTGTTTTIIDVGDVEGHAIAIGSAEGTNFNASPDLLMDGARVVVMGSEDLVKGAGPSHGYNRLTKDGETIFIRYSGTTTIATNVQGQVERKFEGTYSYMDGTGPFQGIHGGGTYKGKYTSEKTYVVEWEGEYGIK